MSNATAKSEADPDPFIKAAKLLGESYRAEMELLASIANGPRQGRAILEAAAINVDHFTADDAIAIFIALHAAGDATDGPATWSGGKIARMCKGCLEAVGHWSDAETRGFCTGTFWGAAALAHFLTAVPFDVANVQRAVEKLKTVRVAIDALKEAA